MIQVGLGDTLVDFGRSEGHPGPHELGGTFIFDLDGTLSDAEHRIHLIDRQREGGPDWDAFFLAAEHDKPIWSTIVLMQQLMKSGCRVEVWTGRSSIADKVTINWLTRHNAVPHRLRMRRQGCHIPDHELKPSWLGLGLQQGAIVTIFEDRARVVSEWRKLGLHVCQVAEGNF